MTRLTRSGAVALCGLMLLVILSACGGGSAQAGGTVLSIISGEVTVRQGDGAGEAGENGQSLSQGDTITTGEDGVAVDHLL